MNPSHRLPRRFKPFQRIAEIGRTVTDRLSVSGDREHLRSGIEEAASCVRQAAADTMSAFCSLGEVFRTQSLLTDQLLEEGDKQAQRYDTGSGNAHCISEAIEFVRRTLSFVDECAVQNRSLIEAFKSYHTQFERVRKGEDELARTLVPLQIIERLFRIEAAVLPQGMQSAFDSLTKEISALHGEMRGTLDVEFKALSETSSKILAAHQDLSVHASALEMKSCRTKAKVEGILEEIENRLERDRSTHAALLNATKSVSSLNDVVMIGLQFQDIMHQRCEHVEHALGDALSRVRSSKGWSSDLRRVKHVCALQAKQVEAVGGELAAASGSIEQGLSELVEVFDRIEQDCFDSNNLSRSLRSLGEVFGCILAALEESLELALLAQTGAQKAYDAVQSFGGTASNVTHNLRELASGIKLIALNAQVQAAQIGDGTGLEVLSGKTCDLSDETERFTTGIGTELHGLVELLNRVVEKCSKIKDVSDEHIQLFDTKGSRIKGDLERERDDSIQGLNALIDTLSNSRSGVRKMQQISTFEDGPVQLLKVAHERLQAVGVMEEAKFGETGSEDGARSLSERYTMDSERQIHRSFFAGSESEPLKTAATPRATPTSDDMDVEFF